MNRPLPDAPSSKPARAPTKTVPGADTPAADLSIAGVIGSELSESVHAMRRIVQGFHDTNRVSRLEMAELVLALDKAGTIARQSQQLARLAEGRLRQSHERVSLDFLVESAVKERQQQFRERGIDVKCAIKPVEIVVDPGLLSNLVDTAMEWALQNGQRLAINLGINQWPEHGVLSFRSSRAPDDLGADSAATQADPLSGYLLAQIAKAMGVTLRLGVDGAETTMSLEFARTVKHLEGLTSMEIEASTGDSAFHTGTKALAGLRVLLISRDASVRGEVEMACNALGLRPDTVSDSEKAVRFTERDQPHMIIVDERLRDKVFDDLMQDIRRVDPNFGFLEVTDDADTFEVSSWMSDSMTRVSRNVLRQHLPSVLTLELAKAF
jgi:hypothetical protein